MTHFPPLHGVFAESRLCAYNAETMGSMPDFEPQRETVEAEAKPETVDSLSSIDTAVERSRAELQIIREDGAVFARDIAKVQNFQKLALDQLKNDIAA